MNWPDRAMLWPAVAAAVGIAVTAAYEALTGPGPVWLAAALSVAAVLRFGIWLAPVLAIVLGLVSWAAGTSAATSWTMAAVVLIAMGTTRALAPGLRVQSSPWRDLAWWGVVGAVGPALVAHMALHGIAGGDPAAPTGLALLAGLLCFGAVSEEPASDLWPWGGAGVAAGCVLCTGSAVFGAPLLGVIALLAAVVVAAGSVPLGAALFGLAGAGLGAGVTLGAVQQGGGAVSLALVLCALASLAVIRRTAEWRDTLHESEDRVMRRTLRIRYLLQDRDEVTALAVHDLQSPIQAIGGMQKTLLYMLEQGHTDTTQMRNALQAAISTSADISDRIGSVLSAKRPHLGGSGQRAPASSIVDHTIAAHRLRVDSAKVHVTHEVPAALSLENVEEIKDILDVLFDNALSHVGPEGRIAISAQAEGPKVVVSICDDGPGVPEDRQASLFTRTKTGSNTDRQGIGLYLAQRRARALGGTLTYAASDWGGARFSLHLPNTIHLDASTPKGG